MCLQVLSDKKCTARPRLHRSRRNINSCLWDFFSTCTCKFLLNKKINQSSYCSPLLYHHEITVGSVCYMSGCVMLGSKLLQNWEDLLVSGLRGLYQMCEPSDDCLLEGGCQFLKTLSDQQQLRARQAHFCSAVTKRYLKSPLDLRVIVTAFGFSFLFFPNIQNALNVGFGHAPNLSERRSVSGRERRCLNLNIKTSVGHKLNVDHDQRDACYF